MSVNRFEICGGHLRQIASGLHPENDGADDAPLAGGISAVLDAAAIRLETDAEPRRRVEQERRQEPARKRRRRMASRLQ